MKNLKFTAGPWLEGLNSSINPELLRPNIAAWSTNTMNRGASYQTRPGLVQKLLSILEPSGFTWFKPRNKEACLVLAFGNALYYSADPFTQLNLIGGLGASALTGTPVHFETCIKGANTTDEGTVRLIDPYPVLMIQTGDAQCRMWDGTKLSTMNPDKDGASQTPIGTAMKWIGNRLWVMTGNRVRISNILEPDKFTEEDAIAGGGFYVLPEDGVGFGVTPDLQALLAFTNQTTTTFQANILDRDTWSATPGFQRVLFQNIGCIAERTIISKYGMLWWMSQGGITNLNMAIQTYRSSKMPLKDANMARSKANLSGDVSRACAGEFENLLFFSVPSGDNENAHTWVMDQGALEDLNSDSPPQWASCWTGFRPRQWVTFVVNGRNRCFCFCKDLPRSAFSDTRIFESCLYEAVTGVKMDVTLSNVKRSIPCSLETAALGTSDGYKDFMSFSAEISSGGIGQAQIDGYYASRQSSWNHVLTKSMVFTTTPIKSGGIVSGNIPAYVKQTRTVQSEASDASVADQGVESRFTGNRSKNHSLLLHWTGDLAIDSATLYCTTDDIEPTPDAYVEDMETTERYVLTSGIINTGGGVITATAPSVPSLVSDKQSSFTLNHASRTEEELYQINV